MPSDDPFRLPSVALMAVRGARWTIAGLAALVVLELLWELVLAPQPTHGAWLALKALPLAILFPGVARGERRPRQWLSLLVPFYFAEALTRAWSESGRHAMVASMAAVIAAGTFIALLVWFRAERATDAPQTRRRS